MTISSQLFSENMLARFSEMNEAIQLRQTKISTGQSITAASDSPIDAVRLSALNELTSEVDRYATNLTVAQRRLLLGDNALQSVDNLYTRLREVQLSAASDTLSNNDRASIKLEILGVKDQLLGLANTADSSNQALFGGYATDLEPFSQNADGSIAYLGDAGDHTLRAGETLRLPTSVNGGDVFMRVDTGGSVHSAFDLIDSFAQSLDLSAGHKTFSQDPAAGGLTLDIVADRRPQNWSFDITGPNGVATVSFLAVDGNPDGAKAAINAVSAATGVTATDSASDGRSLELATTTAAGTETIRLSNLKIEGQDLANFPPSYFAKVTTSADGRAALLTTRRALAPVPDLVGTSFAPPSNASTAKFALEGKEYTLTYTPSGTATAGGTAAITTTNGEVGLLTANVGKGLSTAAAVRITNDSGANITAAFTVTGFLADGTAATESIAVNNSTGFVDGAIAFQTITSIESSVPTGAVSIGTAADVDGIRTSSAVSTKDTALTLSGALLTAGDIITLSVAGGMLDGGGPTPLNNAEAGILGLSNSASSVAGAAHPQTLVQGRAFTALSAGSSQAMEVNLNGKSITINHAKASDGSETITTNELLDIITGSSGTTGVTTGSGTRSNIWTATGNTTTLTIEGETLTANAETVIGATPTGVSVISSGNIIQADGGTSTTMTVVIAGVTVNAAGDANQNTRAANLKAAIDADVALNALNIKATASTDSSGQVTLSDPNARALALAIAINNDVELAAKGVQAKASTDGTGFLSVGTLTVSGENATQPGGGKAINPTTKINISSDAVLGHISVVDSLTSPLMGFDVSQGVLGTLGETLIIPVSQGMSAHKEHMSSLADSIALSRTVLGSRLQRVTSHEAVLGERSLLLSQEVGDLSQANIEELITELTSLMVSRDASRQAYSMISQSSLFDFIK
jgi:flagellar hook-associated protein 3 FlgL